MENGQSTTTKLGLPPLTPNQQEALQKVIQAVGGGRVSASVLLSLSLPSWSCWTKVAPPEAASVTPNGGHVTL